MDGILYRHFVEDHRRLEHLLVNAAKTSGAVSLKWFDPFRAGILRHIWQEEKVLLPEILRCHGSPFETAERLRLDHGAIAALLVPVPTTAIVNALRSIFVLHNPIEEEPGGLYDICETIAAGDLERLMAEVRDAPEIPTIPYNRDPSVLDATRRAVSRAGYDFDQISSSRE